jgi:mevalonate kinase
MGGVGSASAKLILFGEHAAVHGHPAIGVSLPEETTVLFSGEPGDTWGLQDVAAGDRDTVSAVLELLEGQLPGLASRGRCRVRIESSVPRRSGLGSSASLCSAFARAALEHLHGAAAARDNDRAWGIAHSLERLFHGTPSGIDTGLSILGGTVWFQPRPPGLPLHQPLHGPPALLVAGALPRDEACAALVGSLGERMRAGERLARQSIESLGTLAAEARAALEAGSGIGGLADRAMAHLRRLGLSSPALDLLLQAGRNAGALGGKLSGAGGGGAFFLVAESEGSARAIADRLSLEAARASLAFASPPRILTIGEVPLSPGPQPGAPRS